MQALHDATLGETLYLERLPSGLAVAVLPKPGKVRKFATLAARYGSIDNRFVVPGESRPTEVPDGIAHFLEHKLFEEPDGENAFDKFARLGADTNAYTYYTTTTYLFSCADRFAEALDLLIDFVSEPYFTDENVEKEKGIIEQELRMYHDSPGWRVQSNLLQAMYQRHPLRVDIGGTVESIRRIDKETLYRCYRTFYHPSNMVLFAVGEVEPGAVIEQVAARIGRRFQQPQGEIRRLYPEEPAAVGDRWVSDRLVVSQPIFRLGFKDRRIGLTASQQLEKELLTELALEALFGKGSPLYQELYEEGLIDETFHAGYEGDRDYGYTVIGGETRDPRRLHERLLRGIDQARRGGIAGADFERVRRSMEGAYLRLFDRPDWLAFTFNSLHFRGIDLFEYPRLLRRLDADAASARLMEHLDPEASVVSVIEPKAG